MKQIPTLKQAWLHTMREILNPELSCKVEDYAEIRDYQISFSFDHIYDLKADKNIFQDYLEMHKVFFSNEKNCFGHNYADAILVPTRKYADPTEAVSEILRNNQTTRKAVMTFIPYDEMKIPCISLIQFLVRDDILNITYYARGQDVYRKFPCDAMCIAEFGEKIAENNHYLLGTVTAVIVSAHVYFHDFEQAKQRIAEADRCVIFTGNLNKYNSYSEMLHEHEIDIYTAPLDIPEIQSSDWKTVIKAKAKYAYEQLKFPVWVDDVSLELDAYPLFPGPYTKSVWKQIGIEGLKLLLTGKPDTGRIMCRMCRYNGSEFECVSGENKGRLCFDRPVENEKMPLNSIFDGEGHMAHRTKAIQKLINKETEII